MTTTEKSQNYDQVKHLEFIQATISRMANSAAACKGWAMTLLGALIVFDPASLNSRLGIPVSHLAAVILIVVWYLDSYYLRSQRLFRQLYDDVRMNNFSNNPYTMDFTPYVSKVQSVPRIIFSISEILYPVLIVIMLYIGTKVD